MELEDRTTVLDGMPGRDADRRYRLHEIDPLTSASLVLRLVSALRVESIDNIQEVLTLALSGDNDEAEDTQTRGLNPLLRLLAGCDAAALYALIADLLQYVEVARDPRFPTAWTRLDAKQDVKEMLTLGKIVGMLVRFNFTS